MTIAACDPEAFYPLRSLVSGQLRDLADLAAIERFVRTVLLHDEIFMDAAPLPYSPEADTEWTDEEKEAGYRPVIVSFAPVLTGFEFFADMRRNFPSAKSELSVALMKSAADFSNAGEGNAYFTAHVEYLKRMLGVIEDGGSALLCSEFGQLATGAAQRYPENLFQELDKDWSSYVQEITRDGVGFLVPPVLGIILTRSKTREAIPSVICEVRDEWADARKKVWNLLHALRNSPTIAKCREVRRELSEASLLFSPESAATGTNPIRALWDLFVASVAGAITAKLSGTKPLIGAASAAVGQVARSVTPLAREYGPEIFRRGAFDLARKVRKAVDQVELGALRRLLSEGERRQLGLG